MEGIRQETLSIRESASARSLKKYGSTSSKQATKNENYIRHYVENTDTLQGIALKYDVSIEQIRRANRLWASDSLFLKPYLLVPVPLDVSLGTVPVAITGSCSTPVSPTTRSVSPDEDIDRFLGKIDAEIASTKADVKKVQNNSRFVSGADWELDRRKPVVSRMKQIVNNNGVNDTLTVVVTQGKTVKTSIRRHEQQQDELFEL